MSKLIKCDACGFFDCGLDCRCECHPPRDKDNDRYNPAKHDKIAKEWSSSTQRKEETSMEGLSSLFG